MHVAGPKTELSQQALISNLTSLLPRVRPGGIMNVMAVYLGWVDCVALGDV
jgi:hypothetical protein